MTIAIIISTHGVASEHLLKTTEMIVGIQKNVTWVSLFPNENTDILFNKYNKKLLSLNTEKGVLFLVDTWGGSPFNAANKIILNKQNYDVVTGVNIPMLIEIFMVRNDVKSFQELVQIALDSGSKNIQSIKNSSLNKTKLNVHQKSQPSDILKNDNKKTPISSIATATKNNEDNHMTIVLARIDDRLIHGQVVTGWAKKYDITRIIVINDEVADDPIRKNILTQVTPPGITAHVLSINKAIRVYNNPKYAKDKVILLFTNPTDVLRLVENGIYLNSINIGGMAFCKGKTQVNNAVSINEVDIKAFKKLDEYGIELEVRKVPSDSSLKMMNLIDNIS